MKREWGIEKCIGLLLYVYTYNYINNILNAWNMNNIKKNFVQV